MKSTSDKRNPRLAVLYSQAAPYTLACLRHLHEAYGVEILGVFWKATSSAPFHWDGSEYLCQQYVRNELDPKSLDKTIADFAPDCVYVSGWMDKGYVRIARHCKRRNIPVISGLDGQWRGSVRQYLASYFGRYLLRKCFDMLWVTGDRQAQFAKRLGFSGTRLLYGFYCCDWNKFSSVYEQDSCTTSNRFLYVGRYSPEKGLHVLVKAYRKYRSMTSSPWNLDCAGTGVLGGMLEREPGVTNLGFVQTEGLPKVMGERTAFVLPSTHEPWGVVVQEAAAAGRVLICSDACGAAVHLVQDGYNGYLFEAGNADQLANCLLAVGASSESERRRMSRASHELSKQFTPERWAATLMKVLRDRMDP